MSVLVVVHLAQQYLGNILLLNFGLWPIGEFYVAQGVAGRVVLDFQIWQLFTYSLLHSGTLHLFSNIFGLWMFGTRLEQVWGGRRFLLFYTICVLSGAVTNLLVIWTPTCRKMERAQLRIVSRRSIPMRRQKKSTLKFLVDVGPPTIRVALLRTTPIFSIFRRIALSFILGGTPHYSPSRRQLISADPPRKWRFGRSSTYLHSLHRIIRRNPIHGPSEETSSEPRLAVS